MYDDEDEDLDSTIPGQIDVSELFVRDEDSNKDEEEERVNTTIDGQISFDNATYNGEGMDRKDDKSLNKEEILNKIMGEHSKTNQEEKQFLQKIAGSKQQDNSQNTSEKLLEKLSKSSVKDDEKLKTYDTDNRIENSYNKGEVFDDNLNNSPLFEDDEQEVLEEDKNIKETLIEKLRDDSVDFNENIENKFDNNLAKEEELVKNLDNEKINNKKLDKEKLIDDELKSEEIHEEKLKKELDEKLKEELDKEELDDKELYEESQNYINSNSFNEGYSNENKAFKIDGKSNNLNSFDEKNEEDNKEDFSEDDENDFNVEKLENNQNFKEILETESENINENKEGDSNLKQEDIKKIKDDFTNFENEYLEDENFEEREGNEVASKDLRSSNSDKQNSKIRSSAKTFIDEGGGEDSEQIKKEKDLQHDVDLLNRDFEEVGLNVGSDAFGVSAEKAKLFKDQVLYDGGSSEVIDGMIYKNIETVLHESMIPYSEHIILDRALPRVEDGLKPVQRRILYDMYDVLGLRENSAKVKSARIVGDCLGKFHPHGDSSVYMALVNMAQPFNYNEILIEGQGNFGSIDGDSPAAMRYTEAKLSPLALELLRDLDKNTVKWGLNFDDTLKEPEMLPGRFPNLLVNGATGIAVGLATNIPTHNLAETIDGVIAYIDNPNITLKEMMKIIKGPDFPTGGYILDSSELVQAYATGKGKIYLRGKIHLEGAENEKKSLVITEIPYGVNKAALLRKIVELREEEKYGLSGIQDIRDESDREGMRAVIVLKKDADVNKIYNSLLKNTDLQCTFGVNMVAIAGSKPKQMGLIDIIAYYSQYQKEIILRRSKYELEQAKERAHILEGLVIAIKNIDAVVKIIKTSKNTTEAKLRLKEKFKLSDKQAQAILDMRLAKLTSLEVYKLEEELKNLHNLIKYLSAVIASPKKQFEIVKQELNEIKKKYKKDRKTKFLKDSAKISFSEEVKKEATPQNVIILKSMNETFKLVKKKNYELANKEIKEETSPADINVLKFECLSNSKLLCFTSLGNCYKLDASAIPECKFKGKGIEDYNIFKGMEKEERIISIINQDVINEEGNLMFYTKFGMLKKTPKAEYNLLKTFYQAIKLKDGDELMKVEIEKTDKYNLIFVTKQGIVLNAKTDDIPVQGRVAGGVKGIMLADKDYCLSIDSCVNNEGEIVIITNSGQTKRVIVASIDESVRYRKGVKINTGENLAFASLITLPKEICVFDTHDNLYFRSTNEIRIATKNDKAKPFEKGKKLIAVKTVVASADS